MGKYLIGVLGVMVIILVGVLGYRIFLSGEGDTWICDNGGWIKHGSPSTPMPSGECGEDDQEPLTATNQNEQNKVASGEFVARCEVSGGEPELSGEGWTCVFANGAQCTEEAINTGQCEPFSGEELNTQAQKAIAIHQLSNVSMLKSGLAFLISQCSLNGYPESLSSLADNNVCEGGGAPLVDIPRDVFTGRDYIYSSSGEDYELRYLLDLPEGDNTVSGYQYVDGWNTATKDYLSREGGH